MNEIDILKKLASNLTEKKSVAALNNYEVLCNNIEFSHDLLEKGINYLAFISNEIKNTLDDNNLLNDDYKNGQDLNSFALIIPSLIFNDLEVIKKLSLFKPEVWYCQFKVTTSESTFFNVAKSLGFLI